METIAPLFGQASSLDAAAAALGTLNCLKLARETSSLRRLSALVAPILTRLFSPDLAAAFVVEGRLDPDARTAAALGNISALLAQLRVRGIETDLVPELDRTVAAAKAPWRWIVGTGEACGESAIFILGFERDMPAARRDEIGDAVTGLIAEILGEYERARRHTEPPPRLATMYTMLADIASQLDIDRLLETIVDRARTLLASDSAYLAEVDEVTRLVTMRVTTGIDDPGYKRASIEIGKGLAGATAALRRVMYSNDYMSDARFIHTPDTDANMLREGMRSALAAPLQVGDRVIGVLAVTNHRQTEFSEDDLHLIQSLADGAAIALENARLYEEQKRMVDKLRDLNALTTRQHESLKRSVLIHDRLTELVLHGRDIEAIAERLSILIANPVVVLGRHFNQIAAVGVTGDEAERVANDLEQALSLPRHAPDLVRLTVERRPIHLAPGAAVGRSWSLIVAPIMAGADVLGFVMVIEGPNQFDVVEFQALEQAATVFALAFTREQVVEEVENRLRGDFVNDLIAGTLAPEEALRRAVRHGLDLTLPYVILMIAPDPPAAVAPTEPGQDAVSLRRLENGLHLLLRRRSLTAQTTVNGDAVVVLLAIPRQPDRDTCGRDTAVAALHRDLLALSPGEPTSIGVSRPCQGPGALPGAFREARQALRTGGRLGLRHAVVPFERLGVDRLLGQISDLGELSDYATSALGPILDYDAAHGTDLVTTLHAYLAAGRRQREAAEALGIHINSLNYRLRRIEEIGELSLDDAESCLNLHLALRARQVILVSR
jgi:sugar diacid utilization regulator/GAF domain-containing protein